LKAFRTPVFGTLELQGIFTDIMGLFSTTWHNWPSKSIEFCGKKRKLRAITSFKVIIEVYINRKPLCDFLLVININ